MFEERETIKPTYVFHWWLYISLTSLVHLKLITFWTNALNTVWNICLNSITKEFVMSGKFIWLNSSQSNLSTRDRSRKVAKFLQESILWKVLLSDRNSSALLLEICLWQTILTYDIRKPKFIYSRACLVIITWRIWLMFNELFILE